MSKMSKASIVGILDDGWDGLSGAAQRRIAAADVLIGAGRTLQLVRSQLTAECAMYDMDGALAATPTWITAALAAGKSVVVLASGDPLCHGIATFLLNKLDSAALEVLPAPSTLQIACARWKKPWQNLVIASCHGVDSGEWELGAPPQHGLYPVMRAIALNQRVCAFMSPQNDPARLARALLIAGLTDATLSIATRLYRPDEAIHVDVPVAAAAAMRFASPSVVLVERATDDAAYFGREDSAYMQRTPANGLITKQEVRALTLAKLRLSRTATVWDIGAGSGSVGLEAAALAPLGHVWAIEKNVADAAIVRANAARFRISNFTLVEGTAPQHIADWPHPDAVFIGGSNGALADIIRISLARLRPGGRLVVNVVTLENLATASTTLQHCGAEWDVVQLQASRSQPLIGLHRMVAQNPVWIISASKESSCLVMAN